MKYFLLICAFLFFNCEQKEPILVDQITVEGQIEEGKFATIYLTNSLPFKGRIDSIEVSKSIERKAKVILSNGDISEILTLKKDDSRFPFFFYRSNTIKGEQVKNYSLSINIRGKEFISETTIPKKAKILDVSFSDWVDDGVANPNFKDINLLIDNDTEKTTYFKILIKKEEEDKFFSANPFLLNTENIKADQFPFKINYLDKDEEDENKRINKIRSGGVIELKFVSITKEQFDFWKSIKGDLTTPVNSSFSSSVASNISNGAFGYWSGENTVSFKFKIPK